MLSVHLLIRIHGWLTAYSVAATFKLDLLSI
jgi:hypothetical protein